MAKKIDKEDSTDKKETKTKKTVDKTNETKTAKPDSKTKKATEESKKTKTSTKNSDSKKVSSNKEETKKAVAKKTTTTTKKTTSKKKAEENKTAEIKEEIITTPIEETIVNEEEKETISTEENIDSSPTTINEDITKEVIKEKPKKKKNILLKVILGLVILACAIAVAIMCLANNISTIEEHFDPIDIYKDQLVVSEEDKDKSKEVLLAINLLNNITIDENTYDATLAVSKPVVYNFFDIDTLNNIEYLNEKKLVINQFGYDIDPENSVINVYTAVKYNNFLNMGITAQLTYEFTDTDFVIKFKDAQIGNLPAFLYKSKLPESGKEIFRQNISDFNVVNDIKVRFLDPLKIKDIKYEDDIAYISLNIEDAVNDLINELFDTSNGDSKFAQIANYYLKQLFNDSSDVDYTSLIDSVSAWAQSVIGDLDTDSIGNLINIFAK